MTGQVVELRVWRVDRVASALLRMAAGRVPLRGVPGLEFAKLLGTGSGETFTVRDADLHHWALLTVWSDLEQAERFADGPVVASWERVARESLRVRMSPLAARGTWSGSTPFRPTGLRSDGPVAAITRARLRPTRAVRFWRSVPPVSADLREAPGVRMSLGVGEAPIGLQGTFSLWDSSARLNDFAYGRAPHRAVIARTAEVGWYAEELFARLALLDVSGTYRGRQP